MAVNYLTLRSTLFYNTPGGTSIPAGYINVASTNGVNTMWTNNAALHDTTFSTLTGSTITSVSSIGIGTSNPGYNLDVAGPTRLQTLQQSDTNSALNARGFQNTVNSTIPIASSSCISYTGQYIAGINSGQIAVSSNYGASFTNSSSITNPVLVKISGNGQYLLCINNNSGTFSVYLSTNYGVSWGSAIISFTGNNLNFKDVCFSYDGSYQYFLLSYTIGITPYKQLYRSSNSGTSFQAITQPSSTSLTAISCSSNGQNVVLSTNTTIYYSTNYGDTWTASTYSGSGSAQTVSCSSSGQYVIEGSYGYPQWSNNYGASFTASGGSLPFVYWYTASSASGQFVIASNYNAQTMYYSTDYGQTFTQFTVPSITYNSIAVSQSAQYIIGSGSTSYLLTNASLKSSLITTGNVGIGKTNPVSLLDVAGIATATQVNLSGITAGDAGLQSELTNILNLNNNFRGTTITANPGIAVRLDGRSGENPFQFRYRAGGSATSTEFMVIDSTGRVGIGTGAPGYVLDLYGSNPTLRIRTSATAYTSGTATVLFESITGNYPFAKIVGEDTGVSPSVYRGDLVFYTQYNTGLSERMRIRNDGYITIPGTISLGGNPLYNNGINLPVGGWGIHWGAGYSRIVDDGDLRICTDDNIHFNTGSNNTSLGTERMIILSSGNVGIGTSIPRCKLYVQGTETTGWAGMSYFGGTNWGFVCGQYDANNVYAGAHNAALGAWGNLILCAGGNCGIGVAPSYKLHVSGTSYLAGEVFGTSWFRVVGSGGVWWESYGRGIRAADSEGASYGNITTHGTGINNWNGYDINGRYTFMANGNTVGVHDVNNSWVWNNVNTLMTINKTLYCNNYVGIGTTSPSVPLHVSSYAYYDATTNISESYNGGYGYYIYYNGGTTQWSNFATNFSIYARYAIISSTYTIGASDERIKTNIKPIQHALSKIQQLNVVSYDRIDYKERGADAGVIARNVQNVIPRAVHVSVYTLPNIYALATHRVLSAMILITVPCTDSNIKEGSKVKLMIMPSPTKEVEYETTMINWTGSSFEVKPWDDYSTTDNVFVYGTEVNDFLNVDKEQIGILAAGAVKELSYQVEEQSQQIRSLMKQNTSLTAEVADLKAKLDLVMAKLGM